MVNRLCMRLFGLLVSSSIASMLLYTYLVQAPGPIQENPVEFRFVPLYETQDGDSNQTVNPIPSRVSWQEDLGNSSVCSRGRPFIIAVVPSALTHATRRQWIRDTWANPRHFNATKIRAVFILGATTNATLQKLVEEERRKHRDIIQTNFIDSYRNLTYKSISMLSWVNRNCPDVPWLAKIDDDLVVNPWHLTRYFLGQIRTNPSPDKIYGRLRKKAKPWRSGKWSVTKEEFSEVLYPPFVLGPAYVIGRNGVTKLLKHASNIRFFWLEDVFTTGLTARKAGISHVNTDRTLYVKKLTRNLYTGRVAFYIGATDKLREAAWRGILRYSNKKPK